MKSGCVISVLYNTFNSSHCSCPRSLCCRSILSLVFCSSLKDIDSYRRFSHLFHLIGEIYKSRKGNIPCPDLRALIKTLWVSRIFSHSCFSHFFELLRWHLNNTLLYRGTSLKREYISTEFNCRQISVIVYPANRGYIF